MIPSCAKRVGLLRVTYSDTDIARIAETNSNTAHNFSSASAFLGDVLRNHESEELSSVGKKNAREEDRKRSNRPLRSDDRTATRFQKLWGPPARF